MADALTARQTQILKSLIDEYIETADAVGSESLDKKYNLGVSPATIRNEMVALTKAGYLKQPHTSAGRVPTPTAMKFYVDQLMEEKKLSLAEEVKAKEDVWDVRGDINELLREATHALAESTNTLAVGALDSGRIWHSGYANVFSNPEFEDLTACAELFSFLEQVDSLHRLFFERITGASPIEVLFGEEMGWPGAIPLGVAATRFKVRGKEGALGVIGPARLHYPTIIPTLRYFRNLLEEIA
jgi:heat-inducible transcriptional repressor